MITGRNRTLYDAADQVLIGESSLCRCGRVFRIRCKIRVWVYIDDEGRAGRIDTKIDARITAETEKGPSGQRELLECFGKFGLVVFQAKAAQYASVGRAVRSPFGVVAEDLGR